MTKHAIMALEEMDEERIEAVEPVEPEEAEQQMVEVTEGDQNIEAMSDQIEEAESMGEAVDSFTEQAEEAVENGEGLDEGAAEAMEVAVEHFCQRLGYVRKDNAKVIPALEGFSKDETRLEQTKIALEHLREMRVRLDKNLAIAQENVFQEISAHFSAMFASEKSVMAKIGASLANFTESGAGEPIKAAAWGRYIGVAKIDVTPEDVSALVKDLNLGDTAAIAKHINELAGAVKAATKEIRGTWILAGKENMEKIKNIHEEIAANYENLKKHMKASDAFGHKHNFIKLSAGQAKSIGKEVENCLKNKDVQNAVKNFEGESSKHTVFQVLNSFTRLYDFYREVLGKDDLHRAREAVGVANVSVKIFSMILSRRTKVLNAVASYIAASSK